uniref:PIPK domain-containing protein n=1 Tax=Zea mays TaxID=4577 RepID=A0A804UJH6_MAIZE
MGHTVAAAAAAAELALGFTKPNAVEPPQVCLLHRGPRIRCSSSWLVSPCRKVDKDCELLEAERIMDYSLLVGCGLTAIPHIESRVRHFRTKYGAIEVMLANSGFSWDENRKMVQCEKQQYEDHCKRYPDAKR